MKIYSSRVKKSVVAVAAAIAVAQACLAPNSSANDPLDAPKENAGSVQLERPSWKVGDRWVIETLTRRTQVRELPATREPAKVRWQFAVAAIERMADNDCYRIDVECLAKGLERPTTSFWVDRQTLFMRQIKTEFPVAGAFRSASESFAANSEQSSPVISPLNALPIDMPAFIAKGSKGIGTFAYTSQAAPAGSKDIDAVRFRHEIKQEVRPVSAKSLEQLPASNAKAIDQGSACEVLLSGAGAKVVQVWQKDRPWPVYSDNGVTRAWLVKE